MYLFTRNYGDFKKDETYDQLKLTEKEIKTLLKSGTILEVKKQDEEITNISLADLKKNNPELIKEISYISNLDLLDKFTLKELEAIAEIKKIDLGEGVKEEKVKVLLETLSK